MNKLFILIITSICLLGLVSATDNILTASYSNTVPDTYFRGEVFRANNNVNLYQVQKFSSVTATRAYLYNATRNLVVNVTFSGDYATLNYNIEKGKYYHLVLGNEGSSYSWSYNPGAFSYPNRTDIDYVGNAALSGVSWTFDNSSTPSSIINIITNVALPSSLTSTLTSPTNGFIISDVGYDFVANYTATNVNFTNATYYVWESDSTLVNKTKVTVLGNSTNSSSLYIDDFTLGNYFWNVQVCGINSTGGTLCAFAPSNFTLNVGAEINTITYNSSMFETVNQRFITNLTILESSTLYDVKLVYDGEEYDTAFSSSNNLDYILTNEIDTPLVSTGTQQNKTFYYTYVYDIGSTFLYQNSSVYNQSVNIINLTKCSAVNITANFTAYAEINGSRLSPFNFLATFNYWIGNGDVYKTLTINDLGVTESNICLSHNMTYKMNSIIQYEKDNYVKRNYYFNNASFTLTKQNVPLFLLENTDATSYIVDVRGTNQISINDAYLYVQRYYPGTNSFETVGMVTTDNNGKSVFSFEDETEDYRIIVIKNGVVIYTSPVQKVYCSATPCTLPIQIQGDSNAIWNNIGNLTNLVWNLDYNYTTHDFTLTYVDTSGSTHYGRLLVYHETGSRKTVICNTNSTSNAAILICDTSSYNGTITAQAFISRSPENLVYAKTIVKNTIRAVFGFEGLMWAFVLMMVLAIAGLSIAGVPGGIIGTVAAVVLIPVIGIASFGAVFLWGIIILAAFILWLVNQ